MRKFGRRSTAEHVSKGIDLSGKNVLITGANSGLGKETARVLALRGAQVTLACRDLDKAEAARAEIVTACGGRVSDSQLDILQLDLNSLAGVRTAAEAFVSWRRPLHLLICNAGIMIPMERRTDDDFEAHLGVNHLAHFLFSNLLLEPLAAAEGARVIMVSSAAMVAASLGRDLYDLNWRERKFSGMKAYGDSKLMNLMFAREFSRKYASQKIVANALHPGIIATELARDQSALMMAMGIVALPFMKSVPQGAATSVYVATAAAYATQGGLYFGNCRESKAPHRLARDDSACAALWRASEQLTGHSCQNFEN